VGGDHGVNFSGEGSEGAGSDGWQGRGAPAWRAHGSTSLKLVVASSEVVMVGEHQMERPGAEDDNGHGVRQGLRAPSGEVNNRGRARKRRGRKGFGGGDQAWRS
jgi:hypothetical protein